MRDMLFDLQDFYYNVLFLFKEDDEWASKTLAHWNKYCLSIYLFCAPLTVHIMCRYFFTHNSTGSCHAKRYQAIPPPSGDNDLVRLRDEHARQCLLAQSEAPL